jgi:hypothetical protein
MGAWGVVRPRGPQRLHVRRALETSGWHSKSSAGRVRVGGGTSAGAQAGLRGALLDVDLEAAALARAWAGSRVHSVAPASHQSASTHAGRPPLSWPLRRVLKSRRAIRAVYTVHWSALSGPSCAATVCGTPGSGPPPTCPTAGTAPRIHCTPGSGPSSCARSHLPSPSNRTDPPVRSAAHIPPSSAPSAACRT